jgi:predicted negative regulator of RcsB-dependent stress response
MSFKFDPLTQAFVEVKEPTRFKRLMNKKIAPVHPAIVFPIMAVVIAVGFAIIWHNYQNEMKELQRTQSAKHQTKQGV